MSAFCLICLGIGFLLGVLIERGYFCMYNGFANMVITKNYRIVKAVVWGVLFTTIMFHTLSSFGLIEFGPKPFFWLASILGAIMFSMGMVLAGSCIIGTPLRAASGRIVYWFTLLGMGIGGWLVIWGPLAGLKKKYLQDMTKITIEGKSPTFDKLFAVNHWYMAITLIAISVVILVYLYKNDTGLKDENKEKQSVYKKIFKVIWSPLAIGVGFAVVEALAFLSGKSPAGLGGFIKGWATYVKAPFVMELPFSWPVAEITGILMGVFVSSLISKEFRIIKPANMMQVVRLFTGGLLMGLGAVIAAGGCNMAHIMTHIPQLSIGSFVSGMTIIITTVFLVSIFVKQRDL